MSQMLLESAVLASQILLGVAMVMTVIRMVVGPRAQDRVLGLDAFYVTGMLMLITFGIRSGTQHYFQAALIAGMLGFVGTVALAKFLARGEVIE